MTAVCSPALGQAADLLLHRSFAAQNNIVAQPLRHRIVQPLLGKVEGDDLSAPNSRADCKAHIPTGGLRRSPPRCPRAKSRPAERPSSRWRGLSPKKSASSSETLSRISVSPLSAKGTRTYSAWQPSMRQPSSQPPSSQLLMNPCWQNQHSPQKVMQLAATRSPGRRWERELPASTISPTNSCPRHDALFCARHRAVFDVQVAGADGPSGSPGQWRRGAAGVLALHAPAGRASPSPL